MEDYLSTNMKLGYARWNKAAMPIKVHIKRTSNAFGFRKEFAEILEKAWMDWSEASSSKIILQFVSDPDRAQVICSWTDDRKDLMYASAHMWGGTFLQIKPDGLSDVELKILTVPPIPNFSVIPDNIIRSVSLHEVGHALGLIGHSEQSDDIMCANLDPENVRTSLSRRDINTILALYSLDQSEVAKHRFDPGKAAEFSSDPGLAVMKLNNEAVAALAKADYFLAIDKLEQARGMDPANNLVKENLGIAYTAAGAKALITCNISSASFYLTRALPLWGGKKKSRSPK